MSTIQSVLLDRRHSGDRRLGERRQRNVPVLVERRRTQDRRRQGERRQQDLYALSVGCADRLCAELAAVPADNPISRLLVLQKFLRDHRPQQSNEWIMRWARRLRETYRVGDRARMREDVFLALCAE
jgi:hypothetical protein